MIVDARGRSFDFPFFLSSGMTYDVWLAYRRLHWRLELLSVVWLVSRVTR